MTNTTYIKIKDGDDYGVFVNLRHVHNYENVGNPIDISFWKIEKRAKFYFIGCGGLPTGETFNSFKDKYIMFEIRLPQSHWL